MAGPAPVVVHPPSADARRVTIRGEDVRRALRLSDLIEFLRRAGLEDADIEDPGLVEWRGGGSDVWA